MASRMTPPAVSKAVLDKILEIGDQLMDSEVINDLNELNDHMRVWEQYDENKQYFQLNKVAHEGNSYINIKASRGIAPPDEEHWLLIAARGEDGEGIGDMLKSVYDKNDNDIVDMSEDTLAVGGIPADEMATKEFSKSYTDEQIALVTETGIPKPVRYEYKIEGLTGQDTFEIPLPTFDIDTDIVSLFINTNFIDKTRYSVTERDIILNGPLEEDKIVVIVIDKNVPMGPDGSVSPEVLSHINVDDSQVPVTNTGSVSTILSNEANMIKQITGEDDWKTAPVTSIKGLKDSINDLSEQVAHPTYEELKFSSGTVLPNYAKTGSADVSIKGKTVENLIDNGDFSNGTTGWRASGGSMSVSNNTLTITSTGNADTPHVLYSTEYKGGRRFFVKARIRVSSTRPRAIGIGIREESAVIKTFSISDPNIERYYDVYGTVTSNSVDKNIVLYVFAQYAEPVSASITIKDVVLVSLGVDDSSFLYSKPDDWLYEYFRGYVQAKQNNLSNVRISSYTANLFDVNRINDVGSFAGGTAESHEIMPDNSFKITAPNTSTSGRGYVLSLLPNTEYVLSCKVVSTTVPEGGDMAYVGFINIGNSYTWYFHRKSIYYGDEGKNIRYTFRTDSETHVPICFNVRNVGYELILKDMVIEVAPSQYLVDIRHSVHRVLLDNSQALNMLPNGLGDVVANGYIHNNVGTIQLDGTENWGINKGSEAGLYSVHLPIPSDWSDVDTRDRTAIRITGFDTTLAGAANDKKVTNIVSYNAPGTSVLVDIDQSRLSSVSLEGFKQWLATNKPILYYKKKRTKLVPTIDTSLQIYEGGSIVLETFYKQVITTSSTAITLDKQLKSLEAVIRIQDGMFEYMHGAYVTSDGNAVGGIIPGTYIVYGTAKQQLLLPEVHALVPVNMRAQIASLGKGLSDLHTLTTHMNDKIDMLMVLNS